MVDPWGSAEWFWDAEVFTPTLKTFILMCELYFKRVIQSGHKVTKEYLFW